MEVLRLHTIKGIGDAVFPAFWEIYEASFPCVERRSLEALSPLLGCEAMAAVAAEDAGQIVGIAVYWRFSDFGFLEHIAINGQIRSRGYGGRLLLLLQKTLALPMLLEVELPFADESQRRVRFYEKHQFMAYTHFDYEQPSYDGTKPAVPMLLMSDKHDYMDAQLKEMACLIRKNVYERHY